MAGARGSRVRYTRWPNPGTLRLASKAAAANPATPSGDPISANTPMASSTAPPCSGPLTVPMAETTAE